MTLHPQAQLLCDLVNAASTGPPSDATLQQSRDGFALLVASGAGEPQAVHAVEIGEIAGVPVRIYRPSPEAGLPVVVYLHGGGWTIGSAEQFDPITRQLANASGAIVLSVDYRLAPEHPFPAPLDDCWAVVRSVAKHAGEFEGDGGRIAVAGDSAGGNLAAVCALLARDAGGPELALQVLVYPVTDCEFGTESYRANATGMVLTEDDMRWFWDCYARAGADPTDWRLSPLRAPTVAGVAPALVITAEHDPLRDEGEAYADRLREAGVSVELRRYDAMVHAFFGLSAAIDASRDAMALVGTALRRAFGTLDA
jgi:acetyl esterase/lipase